VRVGLLYEMFFVTLPFDFVYWASLIYIVWIRCTALGERDLWDYRGVKVGWKLVGVRFWLGL